MYGGDAIHSKSDNTVATKLVRDVQYPYLPFDFAGNNKIKNRSTHRVLTHNVEDPELTLGHDGVDLTHVRAGVRGVDPGQVQRPGAVAVVGDVDARVTCDDVLLHRQDGRLVKGDPRHLSAKEDAATVRRALSVATSNTHLDLQRSPVSTTAPELLLQCWAAGQ